MTYRVLSILVLASLTACAEGLRPGEGPTPLGAFGLAVRGNMEAQIIAVDGEVQTLAPAPGVRRSLAVGRYQTDQVEQPAEVFTRGE